MPRHLAIDANHLSGTIVFAGAKVGQATYRDAAGDLMLFEKAPRLTLTLNDTTTTSAARLKHLKVGQLFSGFVVGFTQNVTLEVEWIASERA